jgi:hypothetical protein
LNNQFKKLDGGKLPTEQHIANKDMIFVIGIFARFKFGDKTTAKKSAVH